MTIVGDSRAYVFLSKHGPLIESLHNGVRLTLEGRVFVLTMLLYTDFLTKESFNELSEKAQDPAFVAYATAVKIRDACQGWLKANAENLKQQKNSIVWPTDLTFAQVGFLMELLVAQQSQVEWSTGVRQVPKK